MSARLRTVSRSQSHEPPDPSPITPDVKDHGSDSPCEQCGHDADRHRRGRCWTDWEGEPVTRAYTHIDCGCGQ